MYRVLYIWWFTHDATPMIQELLYIAFDAVHGLDDTCCSTHDVSFHVMHGRWCKSYDTTHRMYYIWCITHEATHAIQERWSTSYDAIHMIQYIWWITYDGIHMIQHRWCKPYDTLLVVQYMWYKSYLMESRGCNTDDSIHMMHSRWCKLLVSVLFMSNLFVNRHQGANLNDVRYNDQRVHRGHWCQCINRL
jgi:hypothetical protein